MTQAARAGLSVQLSAAIAGLAFDALASDGPGVLAIFIYFECPGDPALLQRFPLSSQSGL